MEQAEALAALKLDARPGWPVMVPFTIPGEVVEVEVHANMDTYTKAKVCSNQGHGGSATTAPATAAAGGDAGSAAVLRPPSTSSKRSNENTASLHRVVPKCPVFGECSGCQYQHVSLEMQRDWKMMHVVEALEDCFELDRAVVAKTVLGADQAYNYRSKLTPHYKPPRLPCTSGGTPGDCDDEGTGVAWFPIGFNHQYYGRSAIVDVTHCPIATVGINAALGGLRAQTRTSVARRQQAFLDFRCVALQPP